MLSDDALRNMFEYHAPTEQTLPLHKQVSAAIYALRAGLERVATLRLDPTAHRLEFGDDGSIQQVSVGRHNSFEAVALLCLGAARQFKAVCPHGPELELVIQYLAETRMLMNRGLKESQLGAIGFLPRGQRFYNQAHERTTLAEMWANAAIALRNGRL